MGGHHFTFIFSVCRAAIVFLTSITVATMICAKCRVVVLHGKGSSGKLFRARLERLVGSFQEGSDGIEWVFPDAPHFISNIEGEATFEWWKLPKGKRSFDADEFRGVDESISKVENLSPFDIVIGHSQGAMLASILLSRSIQGKANQSCRGAILSGAAWPLPFASQLELVKKIEPKIQLALIHTMSKNDKVNPCEMALQVALCFAKYNNTIIEHDFGHVLPMEDHHISAYHMLLKSAGRVV